MSLRISEGYYFADDSSCMAYIPLDMIASLHIVSNKDGDSGGNDDDDKKLVVVTTITGKEFVHDFNGDDYDTFCKEQMEEIASFKAGLIYKALKKLQQA